MRRQPWSDRISAAAIAACFNVLAILFLGLVSPTLHIPPRQAELETDEPVISVELTRMPRPEPKPTQRQARIEAEAPAPTPQVLSRPPSPSAPSSSQPPPPLAPAPRSRWVSSRPQAAASTLTFAGWQHDPARSRLRRRGRRHSAAGSDSGMAGNWSSCGAWRRRSAPSAGRRASASQHPSPSCGQPERSSASSDAARAPCAASPSAASVSSWQQRRLSALGCGTGEKR